MSEFVTACYGLLHDSHRIAKCEELELSHTSVQRQQTFITTFYWHSTFRTSRILYGAIKLPKSLLIKV